MRKKQGMLFFIFLVIIPNVLAIHSLGIGGLNPGQIARSAQPVHLGFTIANGITSPDEIINFSITAPPGLYFTSSSITSPVAFSCTNPSTSLVQCMNSTDHGLGNGTFAIVTAPTLILADGSYIFTLTTTDKTGSQNTLTYTLLVDSVGPSLTITRPEAKIYTTTTIPITLTAGSDALEIWYIYNGTNITYTPSLTKTFSDGNYTFIAYTKDSIGNVNNASISFTVDTTVPQITITTPADGTKIRGEFSVNTTITDTNGILAQSVQYRVENVTTNSSWQSLTKTGDAYSGTVSNTLVSEGDNIVRIAANDSSGNQNTKTLKVIKDSIAPAISDLQTGSITETTAVIGWTTSEAANMSISYGTSAIFGTSVGTNTFIQTQSVQLGNLSVNTQYFAAVTNCDQTGNCVTSNTLNFTTKDKVTKELTITKVQTNIGATTSVKYEALPAGSIINYPVENLEIGVKKLIFSVLGDVQNAVLTVNQLKEKPETVTTPDMDVYKYFEVVRTNLQEQNIGNVKISFTVSKKWLEEKNAKKENVQLLRYTSQWDKLNLQVIKEDGDYIEFEANSPGFSVFASGAKAEPKAKVKETTPFIGTGNAALNESKFENLLEEKATKPSALRWVLIVGILALICVGGHYGTTKLRQFRGPHEHKHTPYEYEAGDEKIYKPQKQNTWKRE